MIEAILPVRRWVAKRAQLGFSLGCFLLFVGAALRAYALSMLGLAVVTISAWALRHHPDAWNGPRPIKRGAMTAMMWIAISFFVFVAAISLPRLF